MGGCAHDLIDWQQQDEEMHCIGWVCRHCCELQIGEYHHQTWCREDFCGATPLAMVSESPARELVLLR